ncbi:MAG: dihydroorotate dehydrogenase electron transfer subunit [Lachnospiraceae bacterium]|nr:dihydroorotate dehydrogenase electron transfer subunit [Lachnospiraceae bacterium]
MKIRETATIISQECLCEGIYSMWLATGIAGSAVCGQFISVYPNSDSKLLPRPISLCEISAPGDEQAVRIVYRVAGAGTEEFSHMSSGDKLDILGPNGNGFLAPVKEEITADTKALLIGGGIGIPPMLELAKQLRCNVNTVAGYRSRNEMFLTKELERAGRLFISTDDGSFGTCGTVIDAVNEEHIDADIIFACGPKPMLKGVKELAGELGKNAYISMEERMACGVGACLGCVTASAGIDDHSKVNNKRVCADGPVFLASEVVL